MTGHDMKVIARAVVLGRLPVVARARLGISGRGLADRWVVIG